MLQEKMEKAKYFWALLRPVWSILVVVAIVQHLGAIVGFYQKPVGDTPIDLWYGAAYATPVGFIAGSAWQSFSCPGSLAENKLVVGFMAAMSIALPLFGYLTMGKWHSGLPH
jgi:hypothetical protein